MKQSARNLPLHAVEVLENISEAFIALDSSWRYVYVNAAAEKLLNISSDELLGKVIWDVYPQTVGTPIYKQYLKAAKTRKAVSFTEYSYALNRWVELHLYPYKDGLAVYFRDVTKQKKLAEAAEATYQRNVEIVQELRKSEQRYRAFIANSTEGIWCVEAAEPMDITLPVDDQLDRIYRDVYLAECNDAFARMYGLGNAEELKGARISDLLVRDDPRNVAYLRAFIESGYRLSAAVSHEVTPHGKDVYFENNLVGIIEEGFLKRAWGTQRDVTERILLDKRKDEFVSVASHELRTPLTSLRAFSQLLERYLIRKKDARGISYTVKIAEQLDRITRLVDLLLDVSRIESGRLELAVETVIFDELVQSTIESVSASVPDYEIIKKGNASIPILLDTYRIGQVITNLLTNAAKYSPHSKRVIVSSLVVEGMVELRIQDFGIGIPEDRIKRVFERFYRVDGVARESYPGLGLGLYISAEIVKRHNGTISVESTEGKGTTFIVRLPIENAL